MSYKQLSTEAIAPQTHPTIDPIVENGDSPTAIILAIAIFTVAGLNALTKLVAIILRSRSQ